MTEVHLKNWNLKLSIVQAPLQFGQKANFSFYSPNHQKLQFLKSGKYSSGPKKKKSALICFSLQSCVLQLFPYFSGCVDSRPRSFFDANMDPTGRDTTQQWIKIIEAYFTTKPVLLTWQCMRGFDRNNVPDRSTIQRLAVTFRKKVSVTDGHKDHSGRHR